MKGQIDKVMRGGIQMKEIADGHVREPGKRMPDATKAGRESPFKPFMRQTLLDQAILCHIERVVVGNEFSGGQRTQYGETDQGKQAADEDAFQKRDGMVEGWNDAWRD